SPSRCGPGRPYGLWSGVRPPRFRRDPFARDGVFDHGRASTPRIAAPHILPSATVTASASTDFGFSRLNSPPHAIAVYASRRSSPSAPQHSLPSARYGLLGPDFHRLDRASFAWRTTASPSASFEKSITHISRGRETMSFPFRKGWMTSAFGRPFGFTGAQSQSLAAPPATSNSPTSTGP